MVLGDTWFDTTFNYGQSDPAQEYYGPVPPALRVYSGSAEFS